MIWGNKWLRFGFGLLLIGVFLFLLRFMTDQSDATQQLYQRTLSGDVDNGSLFYTESEEAGKAAFAMRKADVERKYYRSRKEPHLRLE